MTEILNQVEPLYLLALGVFLLAGTVKGAIGIGLPTTSISILSQFTDPRVAIAIGVMPMLLSNVWQMYREGKGWETIKRFWPFGAALFVTLFITSLFAASVAANAIMLITGLSIAIFAVTSLIREPPRMPAGWERAGMVGAGSAGGVMGGLTGLWSPPLVMLLLSLRLDKADYVRAFGFLLVIGAAPLLGGYLINGLMTWELFWVSMIMVIPTLMGFSVGERVRGRMDTSRYQKAILVFFLIMGLNLIRRVLFG
ncbi:MAG: sulfite exporter TauE/SafE family protein [Pseudomonadota bacterium]